MPITKSAAKHLKTSKKSRAANRAARTRILSVRKKLYAAMADGDKATATTIYREYCSVLDKAAKRGTIKSNNAGRNKSRAAKRLATVAAKQ